MKTFLFLIHLLLLSSFLYGAPEPTISITHACNGKSASIAYSYTGEDYQLQWSINGGDPFITKPGAGTLSEATLGEYEVYLLIPGKREYNYYGPFTYKVLDLTPSFSLVKSNDCNGISNDASIQITLNTVHAGYTYTAELKDASNRVVESVRMSGNSHTFGGLAGGNYTVEVWVGEECSYGEAIILQDEEDCPPRPNITIHHACNGNPGHIDYSYTGEDYQLQWSINGGDPFITKPGAGTLEPAVAGTYVVHLLIPGKFNYTYYGPYTYQLLDLTPTFSVAEGNACNGISGDATIKATLTTMHAGYTYTATLKNSNNQVLQSVTMTSTSHTFTGLSAGNYMVEIDAGEECSYGESVIVKDEDLSFLVATTAKTCHDIGGDLEITLPNFQSGATYTVTLTSNDPTSFLGPNTNQVTTFTQTTSSYTLPNVAVGDYTVTVNNGTCSGSQLVTVEAAGVDIIPTLQNKGTCYWQFNATMIGGATATNYTWFFKDHTGAIIPAQNISTIGDLATNTLNTSWAKVVVTTTDGCTYEKEINPSTDLFLNNQLPDLFPYNANCGQSNGSIGVDWFLKLNNQFTITQVVLKQTPSGPAIQTITPNSNDYNASFQGLAAGTYYVDFVSNSGCHTNENLPLMVTVGDDPIEIKGTVHYICSNNAVYITVDDPTTGFNYSWKDPSGAILLGQNTSTLMINSALVGSYEVTVSNGTCTASKYFHVSAVNLGASVVIDQPNCSVDGSLDLHISNEIGLPYTVTSSSDPSNPITVSSIGWSGFNHSFPVSTDGTYSITITNAFGCSQVLSNLVVQDEGLIVRFQDIQNPTSCKVDDGSLDASDVQGGVAPYTYLWNTGGTNPIITNLKLGQTYTVTVTDANGCTGTISHTFNNSVHGIQDIVYSWDGPTCSGGNHGTLYAILTDPAPSPTVSYIWKDAQGYTVGTTASLTGVPSGTYHLTVKDGDGCAYQRTVSMPAYNPFYIPSLERLTKCKNGFDGFSIDYDAFTSCANVTVEIYEIFDFTGVLIDQFVMHQNDPSTHVYSNLDLAHSQLHFVVKITDCCGNYIQVPLMYLDNRNNPIDLIEYPTVTTSVSPANCSTPGSVTLTATGSNAPYNCVWEDGFVGHSRTDLLAGTYTVQIMGAGGCTKEEIITVPGANGGAHLMNPHPCNGSISLDPSNIVGGTGPYSISWTHNGGTSQNGTTLSLLGDYVLEITDASGCVTTEYLNIANQIFTVTANTVEPSCAGNDGQIDLTIFNNSCSVSSYNWTGPNNSTYSGHSLDGLIAGTYVYTVIDAHGCTETGNVVVPNNTTLNASVSMAGCLPQVDNITGGKAPYRLVFDALNANPLQATYSLDLPASTVYPFALIDLLEGDYAVSIIDDNGCVFSTVLNTFSQTTSTRAFTNIQMRWTRQEPGPVKVNPATGDSDIVKDDLMQQAQNFLADADKLGGRGDHCKKQGEDALTLDYAMQLEHYTLYYYNLRDELIRTVPPEGVDFIEGTNLTNLLDWRADKNGTTPVPSTTIPNHTMVTQYDYNALGQMVRTGSPDKGITHSFHASDGLLRFAQDAKQVADKTCSYMLYDDLKRIVESGEIVFNNTLTQSQIESQIQAQIDDLDALPSGITKDEWVKTYYNIPHEIAGVEVSYYNQNNLKQRYLRNNVSYTENNQGVTSTYSYDIHGKVEWIRQYTPSLGENYIAYDYDLITNLVKQVRYNEYSDDQFFHKYTYDEQNRIKNIYISKDGIIWDNDANYKYYAHGRLKRTELGDDKIQGLDYVYTIHGWVKAVNHPFMDQYEADPGLTTNDPNLDGFDGSPVMKDVFGYALGYYAGDYTRELFSNTIDYTTGTSLYNGNIGAWSNGVNLNALDASSNGAFNSSIDESLSQRIFSYDQLNRIKSSKLLNVNTLSPPSMQTSTGTTAYATTYSYDGNGNIQTLTRTGSTPSLIDDLVYNYGTGNLKNRLESIVDNEGDQGVGDLDETQEYTYDEIGNLVQSIRKDVNNNTIETLDIIWRVDGKVEKVIVNDLVTGIISDLTFIYDAAGNRVAKIYDEDVNVINNEVTTYHVRDGKGKILATYTRNFAGEVKLNERTISGSTRLGNIKEVINFGTVTEINRVMPPSMQQGLVIRLLGEKVFELSDHLENVTMTLSDQKQYANNGYEAQILSYQQYYPFGWEMPGRLFNHENYRFGFNGKEDDRHEWGNQLIQDYGFRLYSPSTGKFLSVDPLAPDYPFLTPYAFAENSTIRYIDLDGLEKGEPPIYQKLYDAIHGTYKPQTTYDIRSAAGKNGMWQNAAKGNPILSIGDAYEDAVLRSYELPLRQARVKVPSNSNSKKKFVQPDGISDSRTTLYEEGRYATGAPYVKIHKGRAKNARFVEVKFSSQLDLVKSQHNKHQIMGMIDILAQKRGIVIDGVEYPNLKASDAGLAVLEFITPANTLIGANEKERADIVSYATKNNVLIIQRFTEVEVSDENRIRVANGQALNGVVVKKSVWDKIGISVNPGKPPIIIDKRPSVELNWDKFKKK